MDGRRLILPYVHREMRPRNGYFNTLGVGTSVTRQFRCFSRGCPERIARVVFASGQSHLVEPNSMSLITLFSPTILHSIDIYIQKDVPIRNDSGSP
jgi:hypothetical protein